MIALAAALITLVVHVATAWRYGYFRDELYFIACSRHLAWGYVDQPPLVAVAAWIAGPLGYQLLALRALPMLASALSVAVAAIVARELGGGRFAQCLAAIGVGLLPAYLLLGNTLTTTSFESLSWILAIWCCIRIVRGGARAWWLALAGSIAFGLYGKYSIALLAAALAAGFLATRERRALATPLFPLAALAALLLVAPNLTWQAMHGWPMFEVLAGDAVHRHAFNTGLELEYRNLWTNMVAFTLEQLLYTSPVIAPIWLIGVIAPFRFESLRDLRWLSVAYLVLFVIAVVLGAKGYYIIGIYGSLIAAGAVIVERATSWLRTTAFVAIATVGIAAMPLSLPVLPIAGFIAYSQALHLTGTNRTTAHLMQPVYAEEFGWDRLAHDVGKVYAALPPAQRSRAAIYADTYADAGAIDFFGTTYGLPKAISAQNSYYLWGTHGYDGSTLVAIGATRIDLLKRYYRSVKLVAASEEPLKWAVEGPDPIYICTQPIAPLGRIWPYLRWYGA